MPVEGKLADLDASIRSLRIVTTGVLASLTAFAVVAAIFRASIAPSFGDEARTGLLAAAAFLALTGLMGYTIVYRREKESLGRVATNAAATAEPLAPLVQPYRRLVVLRAALTEAPGLLGALTYLVGGSALGLALAGASAVLLLATMPSRAGLERFADELRT